MNYCQIKILDKISMRISNTLFKNVFEDKFKATNKCWKTWEPQKQSQISSQRCQQAFQIIDYCFWPFLHQQGTVWHCNSSRGYRHCWIFRFNPRVPMKIFYVVVKAFLTAWYWTVVFGKIWINFSKSFFHLIECVVSWTRFIAIFDSYYPIQQLSNLFLG